MSLRVIHTGCKSRDVRGRLLTMSWKRAINLNYFRVWFSARHWGLVNVSWDVSDLGDDKWGLHLVVLDHEEWYWGKFDQEYDRIATYWGLGPLGFVSRMNW
jgi:hypothetical protein